MKHFKFIAVVAMMAISMSASAQFTNTGSTKSTASGSTDGWSTIWVQWNPSTIKYDIKDIDNQSFTGLSFGYSRAFGISPTLPLFVEAGFGVQYSFNKESEDEEEDDDWGYTWEEKFSMFSAKVPVDLIYKYDIPNSSVSLMPFLGVNLRYNLSGKIKGEEKLWGDYPSYLDDYDDEDDEEEVNLFDKKDMGKDGVWKRFQLGWNIGVKARFGQNFLVGLSYGTDLSEIAKKTKIATTSVTLGYTF